MIRAFLFISLLFSPLSASGSAGGTWEGFVEQFVSPSGRVIDYYQQEISHSEGQGYSMLLAVAANDRNSFARMWKWSGKELQVRQSDALFAWSWGERVNGCAWITGMFNRIYLSWANHSAMVFL